MTPMPLLPLLLCWLVPACVAVLYKQRSSQLTAVPVHQIPGTVTELVLSNNSLKTLPDHQFSMLPQLQEVNLHKNSIYLIKPLAFNGTMLRDLDLSSNALTSVPDLNCVRHTLENLNMALNQLTMINQSLSQLANLTKIDLRFNVIQNVSSQAFCGTSLYQLTLRDNSLSSVPDLSCVGHVLGVLILSENLLTEIHRQDFYGLTALEKLSLMTNGIKTIEQDTFYHLTALKDLYLGYNQLTDVDPLAFIHSPLERIYLENSELETFPALTGLNASICVVIVAPTYTGLRDLSNLQGAYMPSLTTLKLMLQPNVSVPTLNTSALEVLNIECMDICELPLGNFTHQMSLFPRLKSLELVKTAFTEVPDLSSLPEAFRLNSLTLRGGLLETVSASALNDLTHLATLNLMGNRLTHISPLAFQQVNTKLLVLDLSDNPILGDTDPSLYISLVNLHTLTLDNTSLTSFPPLPPSLQWLSINNNPSLINISSAHLFPLHSLAQLGLVGSLDEVHSIPDLSSLMNTYSLNVINVSSFQCSCSTAWLFGMIKVKDARVQSNEFPCQGLRFLSRTAAQIATAEVCHVYYQLHTDTIHTKCALLCASSRSSCHGYSYSQSLCTLEIWLGSAVTSGNTQTFCTDTLSGSPGIPEPRTFNCTHSPL